MSWADQGGLERAITRELLVQYTDDNNDGEPDEEVVSELCEAADFAVRAVLLGKGWSDDQITKLEGDKAIRRLACYLCAEMAARRRPQFFLDNGKTLWTDTAQKAEDTLKLYAAGENRSRQESQAGKSTNLQSLRTERNPKFYVAKDPANPNDKGPGGF